MDQVDWRILDELQGDARLSFNELSRRVNLSAPSVAERVRKMEAVGVITGYHCQVDPAAAGRPVRAVVVLDCHGPTCILRDPAVRAWPEIQHFYRVTGGGCSVLVVAVPTLADLEELIDRLARYGRPTSSMVLGDLLPWAPILAAGSRPSA